MIIIKTRHYLSHFFIIFILLLLTSCRDNAPAKVPPMEIPVVEVIQKDVPLFNEYVGQVYGEKDIPIRARVEGFLEGIHFNEGLKVTKGQLLYTIDPLPFEAKVNSQKSKLAEAETMLVKAKSDLDRYKPLAEVNAISQSDLDAKQAEYDANISAVNAARANLRSTEIELGYTRISSPINGIIGKTLAREGDFVGREPNPVILNVVSKTDIVRVTFFLTESDYLFISREYAKELKEGSTKGRLKEEKKVSLELILSDGKTYKHKGRVDFIDRGIDASTGSILVQASFPNPDFLLRPGLYAKVKVKIRTIEGGLLIPQRCVMELQGQHSVYVVNSENKVESRQIKTRSRIGDMWLIKEGLNPDDKVVLEGLQKVSEGMEIKSVITDFESKTTQQ
ncbi:MAG: efflux RND transporter periplasmic adaptor subunit [Bacteroidales bacterium]|nr:efflux RND transporter periplasmic adaptor subunit [Bacteroidales bacterium]